MIKHLFFVGSGGALGSILRYLAAICISKHYSGGFPLATFLINISGCVFIGLFIGLAERFQFISTDTKLFLVTGLCGGYTTFSAFSSENLQLFQNGNHLTMVSYIFFSVLLGIAGVWLGILLSRIG
ncbi:MAG: fluoride efflux transporter CrcB [Flavobacteriaceae bacterium]|jgi:CrcB protein|nr:fluoride efflux transporter CrcB [Flavobacteriaceae bacterium]